jgi:hypothetical protein
MAQQQVPPEKEEGSQGSERHSRARAIVRLHVLPEEGMDVGSFVWGV